MSDQASKAVIMTVDDEPQVLNAVERDLRTHFRSDYRILKAGSGDVALETARKMRDKGLDLALIAEVTGLSLDDLNAVDESERAK